MTYSPPRKLFLFLLTGVICSLFIVTYTRRPKNEIDDALALQNLCVWHSENAQAPESGIQPIYHLPLSFSESTCSAKSTSRGGNQHVISFSFYGNVRNSRSYFQGIERNAELIRQLYPGWVMRVYHNVSEPQTRHLLSQMQCSYSHVLDTCFVADLPGYGNLSGSQPNVWRFLAMSDPLVDVALSRDLDSNLNEREVAAVQEWLQSTASMHVMRDSQYHNVPMLAGMWGIRLSDSNRREWRKMIERLLMRAKVARAKGFDQKLLAEEVWLRYSSQAGWVLQHDSYYCEKYNITGKMLAFPTKRQEEPMNFVGSRFNVDSKPVTDTCPVSCRRKLDWTMC